MAAAHTKRERAMDVLWQRSHTLTEGLVTEEGARLRVLYPGTANHWAGPDFRGAVIATESGERILGDVELHISAPDWYSHGHQDDAGYNGVVLHVVLWPKGSTASRQRSGISTPIASIAGVSDTLKHAREQPPRARYPVWSPWTGTPWPRPWAAPVTRGSAPGAGASRWSSIPATPTRSCTAR